MGICTKKIIFLTLIFFSTSLFANVAKVVALKGNASIVRQGEIIQLTRESILLKHDQITTKDNTKVQLLFQDETIISIGKNSSFQISDYLFDEKSKKYEAKFDMFKGTFKTITGKIGKLSPKNFNLKTKTASIGIRGTQIVMNLSKDREEIFCTEGKILVTKLDSKISSIVSAGEFTSFSNQNNEKIEVKKIKNSDIKKINQSIVIQNNLATDRITIREDREETNRPPLNPNRTPNSENNPNQGPNSKNNPNKGPNPEDNPTLDPNFNPDQSRNDGNMKREDLIQQEIDKAESTTPTDDNDSTTSTDTSTDDNDSTTSTDDNDSTDTSATDDYDPDDLNVITDASYIQNLKDTNSTATYTGDFNSYEFNENNQYMTKNSEKIAIPENTTISMDIDFGADSNQISNGIVDYQSSPDLKFDGHIGGNDFQISGTNGTEGSGNGNFYGKEADAIKGQLNMTHGVTSTNAKFEATKQ